MKPSAIPNPSSLKQPSAGPSYGSNPSPNTGKQGAVYYTKPHSQQRPGSKHTSSSLIKRPAGVMSSHFLNGGNKMMGSALAAGSTTVAVGAIGGLAGAVGRRMAGNGMAGGAGHSAGSKSGGGVTSGRGAAGGATARRATAGSEEGAGTAQGQLAKQQEHQQQQQVPPRTGAAAVAETMGTTTTTTTTTTTSTNSTSSGMSGSRGVVRGLKTAVLSAIRRASPVRSRGKGGEGQPQGQTESSQGGGGLSAELLADGLAPLANPAAQTGPAAAGVAAATITGHFPAAITASAAARLSLGATPATAPTLADTDDVFHEASSHLPDDASLPSLPPSAPASPLPAAPAAAAGVSTHHADVTRRADASHSADVASPAKVTRVFPQRDLEGGQQGAGQALVSPVEEPQLSNSKHYLGLDWAASTPSPIGKEGASQAGEGGREGRGPHKRDTAASNYW